MITTLYRYPVKGLSPENLDEMCLLAGEGIAGDRAAAIARQPDNFNPGAPVATPKHKFLMLMRDEALAALDTSFDEESGLLHIGRHGRAPLAANIHTTDGRAAIEAYMSDYLGDASLAPTVVMAPGHKFTDISVVSPEKMRAISLVNQASVDALNEAEGQVFDPLRFRANIYFTGRAPWSEHSWVGKEIMIGSVRARVVMRTKRCAATQVNPDTAQRDVNVPALIHKHFGHFDMGVYAEVLSSGTVKPGDAVTMTS